MAGNAKYQQSKTLFISSNSANYHASNILTAGPLLYLCCWLPARCLAALNDFQGIKGQNLDECCQKSRVFYFENDAAIFFIL